MGSTPTAENKFHESSNLHISEFLELPTNLLVDVEIPRMEIFGTSRVEPELSTSIFRL